MKQTLITILILAALCGGAWAQPKVNGNAPTREKRGYNQRVAIDTAHVRVLYALNAKDIKDESTYLDLGKLEVGKRVWKYSSEFVYSSDLKVTEWVREKGYKGNVPKTAFIRGEKSDKWSELVYSDYTMRGKQLEPWPLMQWTLANEQLSILGHRCQKATCRFRGRDFVAWFAADVPIKGGPWKFGGLPGLILKVSDVQNIYVWEAVAIERGTYPIMQYPDKLYPKSTRKSVWQRQKKYNEDYRNAIGWTSLDGRPMPPKVRFEPLEKE